MSEKRYEWHLSNKISKIKKKKPSISKERDRLISAIKVEEQKIAASRDKIRDLLDDIDTLSQYV